MRETWMWGEAISLLERAEKLHRQFFRLVASPLSNLVWEPPVDIFELNGDLSIVVVLPGVPSEEVSLNIDNNILEIIGNRPLPNEFRSAAIQRLEIPYGRFERRIRLPPGQFEFYDPQWSNGCLTLQLRRL